MKSIIILLIILLSVNFSYGQNWFPVNRNGINYYESDGKIISGYIRDSLINTTGKIYYGQHNIQSRNGFDCYASAAASWLGKQIISHGDTAYTFFNANHQPIIMLTNTNVGDSWFATENETVKIKFVHTLTSYIKVLDKPDSVKTFGVIVTDKNGNTLPGYEELPITLGKNSGMINTINFDAFLIDPDVSSFGGVY